MILCLLGRISSEEGDGNFGEENQDLKKGDWEDYQVTRNFIHPCLEVPVQSRRGHGDVQGSAHQI